MKYSSKIEKNKIETARFDELNAAMIFSWYSDNKKKLSFRSKGLLATKKAILAKNANITFPIATLGQQLFFQSFFTAENKPKKYRFIVCNSVDKKITELLQENDGYIIFSDIKRGL